MRGAKRPDIETENEKDTISKNKWGMRGAGSDPKGFPISAKIMYLEAPFYLYSSGCCTASTR